MSVGYMQKLALIFIVIFFKPSITGVTSSVATFPGTRSKWSHERRTQTNQAVNRGKVVHNWLNLGSQRAEFVNDDNSNHTKQCQADED